MPEVKLTYDALQALLELGKVERAERNHENAIRKKASAAKTWEEESKRAASAENARHAEAVRMREADDASRKRSHEERQRMYTELFAAQDKQRRGIEEIMASERAYVAQLQAVKRAHAEIARQQAQSAAQSAGERAFYGGRYSAGYIDPMMAILGSHNKQQATDAQAAVLARQKIALSAGQNAFYGGQNSVGYVNPMMAQLGAAMRHQNAMSPHPLAAYGNVALAGIGKTPPLDAYRMKELAKSVGDHATQTEKVGQTSSMATNALAGLQSQLMQFVGLSAVMGKTREMMAFAQEQRQTGATSLKSDFEVLREIAEVSGPGEGATRAAKYFQLKEKLGQQSAWGLLEKAIATGNEGSVDRFAATRGGMDPALAMSIGSHWEQIYGGQINEIEGANMVAEAAKKSRYTVGQFAPVSPTAAVGGTQAGSSAAETLAIMSVMSDKMANPEEVAQRMAYLGTRGKYMGIKSHDKGLMAIMEELSAMSLEERKNPDYAGERVQILSFVDKMNENKALIREREQEILGARARAMGARSNLAASHREFMSIPGGQELLKNQAAGGAEEAAYRDQFATQQLDVESTRRTMRAKLAKRGVPTTTRFGSDQTAGAMEALGGDASQVKFAGQVGEALSAALFPIADLLEAIVKATRENKPTTPAKPSPPVNGGGRR